MYIVYSVNICINILCSIIKEIGIFYILKVYLWDIIEFVLEYYIYKNFISNGYEDYKFFL